MDPLVQVIGTVTIADVITDDAEACVLLDSGATADIMTFAYAKARHFDTRLMTELSDHFMRLNLAFKPSVVGCVEYNLQIPGISSYDSDRVALVARNETEFSKEVSLTIGTKTEDTILEALKEGEMEMLDSIWKRVKMNRSLSKLQEEVGLQEAIIQVAKVTGQEVPEFEDHTPYSNQGMEDLLKLNEIVSTMRTEIIPPHSNKTIKAHTHLVLMGTSMNMMMEPLHRDDKVLPQSLHVHPSYNTYNCGSWKTTVQLYNTKDHAIILRKGRAVATMVAANEVLETVVADGTVGAL